MNRTRKILVAVAWPYASGPRHLGHVAGFGVPADIFARYHRLRGNDVLMVSGTDEHGTPILVAADAEGVSPTELVDRYNRVIREDLRALGLSYDIFTRTSTPNHHRVVRAQFERLREAGVLVRQTAIGAFSAATGRTLPDRYIQGRCPICGSAEARGDQCESCGNQLDPADLLDPISTIDGQPPIFEETEHWFLELGAFSDRLKEWISGQDHWRPNVRNFSLNLLANLRARAITRDIDWGVSVPGWDDRSDKRIYVWFDAVQGYLSACLEWAKHKGQPEAWRGFWEDPDAEHYYFMGKDNIVFHSIIWPSMLMGIGGLNLPRNVVSSEFLTMEGKKFSTSRRAAIFVGDFLQRHDADPLRYYLTVAGPESQDTDFTWSEFLRRNNDELVANWGNLVNRVLVNAHRNFGSVPPAGPLTPADEGILATVRAGFDTVGALIEACRFKAALTEVMRISGEANAYLANEEPWKVVKTDRERAGTVLNVGLRVVDSLKILFTPFLPFSSQKVHEMLGQGGDLAGPLRFETVTDGDSQHEILTGDYSAWVGRWSESQLQEAHPLSAPTALFRKLDERVVEAELERMQLSEAPDQ